MPPRRSWHGHRKRSGGAPSRAWPVLKRRLIRPCRAIPFRLLYPTAIFLICIGAYSANNDVFEVAETLGFDVLGYILIALGSQPTPILLGFVLGPRLEKNFRRAMILSGGDLGTFIAEPISAGLLLACRAMLGLQLWVRLRRGRTMKVATVGFGVDC